MRKIIVVVALLVTSATAQKQTPRFEAFGGYSYLHRFQAVHGWNASATWNLYRWLGATADFSGHYRSDSGISTLPAIGTITVSGHEHAHSFTFGPTVTFRNRSRFTPFAHYLLGAQRLSFSTNSTIAGTIASGSDSINLFNEYFGGGLDVALNPRFALRAGQFDLQYVRYPGGGWERHFRYSAGIVVRFGGKH